MQYLVVFLILAIGIIIANKLYKKNKYKKNMLYFTNQFGAKPNNEDFEKSNIDSYSNMYSSMHNSHDYVDEITWNDLNMDEVYKRICSCKSNIGKEYLYYRLHKILLSNNDSNLFNDMLDYYNEKIDIIANIQLQLSKIGRRTSIVPLMNKTSYNKLKYPDWIYKILALLTIILMALATLSIITSILMPIALIPMILIFIIDGIVHYKIKAFLESKLEIVNQFYRVLSISRILIKKGDLPNNSDLEKFKSSLNKLRNIKPSIASQANGLMMEFAIFLEYIDIIFFIDIRKYNKSINEIEKNIDSFKTVYEYIGTLDAALSVLSYRESVDFYCEPIKHDKRGIEFKEIYHPLIISPVVNDNLIEKNIIITGANASGKSTFIKSIAINNILALTINTCLAREYRLKPVFTITSMALRDDVISGESYYVIEIKSLKRVLDKIEEIPCMCFIDEILRGTNTVERISASISILNFIHEKECLCIVATHDTELAQILDSKFKNYHFEENVTDESIKFNYKIKEGIAKTKNAIKLLSYYKFDKKIVNEANKLVGNYEEIKL